MKHSVGTILSLTLLLVLALGCGRRGRVIPEDKFSDIYAQMLLADQWISSNLKARRVADTTLFYAPILEKYGYDVLDYDASVRHYMKKPEKFAQILDRTSKQLTAYANRLQAVEDEMKKRYKLPAYKPIDFSKDTILTIIPIDTTTNYEPKGNTEEMFLLHGSDDTTSRRHPVKRFEPGAESKQIAR